MSEPVRLHRFIAQCGVCSRRRAEELISEGRVSVNGSVVTQLGTKVTDSDVVEVDAARVRPQEFIYLVMHKPKGVVTTMSDERGRRTVADLLPRLDAVVKPVGRLDKDTEGLLLFTNDGDLAKRLTHPSHGFEKEYEAVVRGRVSERALDRLRNGVRIERRMTSPAVVEVIAEDRGTTKLRIVLKEGWKRQVRLMCEAVGNDVVDLRRVRFGPLKLKGMQPGECRILSGKLLDELRK
jgi:23S rRNA pseudouridine2605 synthase